MISSKKVVIDMMGREVTVASPPQKIVSLVPSQTELLYHLGLTHEVVGQTIFCIHPKEMHAQKERIGGTKKLKMDIINRLNPDLIIGNKEENEKAQVESLMQKYPVWMSDIKTLDDALQMIKQIGALVGKEEKSWQLAQQIQDNFNHLVQPEPKKCLYLIWREPWMAAGEDTFIDDMLQRLGLINQAYEANGRYPQLNEEFMVSVQPEVILLSSEPYPFKEKHILELQQLLPNAKILLVDGELFSWYGSRLVKSVSYFNSLQKTIWPE